MEAPRLQPEQTLLKKYAFPVSLSTTGKMLLGAEEGEGQIALATPGDPKVFYLGWTH